MKITIPALYQKYKHVLISSILTSIITILLLEFFRIFSPLALIENGELKKSDVIKKIRTFYAKDKGKSTTNELMEAFDRYLNKSLQSETVEQHQYQ